MKMLETLEPVTDKAEAEMAAFALSCLTAALDHSKADHIDVTINGGQDGKAPVLKLPPRALRFFVDVLRQMAKQEPIVLVAQKHELTTQEAAAFLNVSRPFVVKEIEAGRLPCRKVNRHRRIAWEDLRKYQIEQSARSQQALKELTKLSEEVGMEF